ncbi:MAG: hypothetical protein M3071_15865, partial [Actinomycetota bacterium]|nr:hypothetical protein [Actinomycetota bacterium]
VLWAVRNRLAAAGDAGQGADGSGRSAALLGTTKRTDGKVQVTYHGHPLYFYAADHAPGDTTGQALNQFGAEWSVLSPEATSSRRNARRASEARCVDHAGSPYEGS